jgi:hypothetical protein
MEAAYALATKAAAKEEHEALKEMRDMQFEALAPCKRDPDLGESKQPSSSNRPHDAIP